MKYEKISKALLFYLFTASSFLLMSAEAAAYRLEYQSIDHNLSRIGNDIIITARASIHLIGDQDSENIFVQEKEIDATASGDFIEQMISPLSGLPNLSHNPYPIPMKIKGIVDTVVTVIDTEKPYRHGHVMWEIPTIISHSQWGEIDRVEIVQEYILEEYNLTIKKGGITLFEGSLK